MWNLIKDGLWIVIFCGCCLLSLEYYYLNHQMPRGFEFRVVKNTYLTGDTTYRVQGCWRSDCLFGNYYDFGSTYEDESSAVAAKDKASKVTSYLVNSITLAKQEVIR